MMSVKRILCLASVMFVVATVAQAEAPDLSATGGGMVARAVISAEQIEADWIRQEQVRWLAPSPRDRASGQHSQVTTQQDAAGGNDGLKNGTYGFHTERNERPWWQVDLGSAFALAKVVVYNRCDRNVESRATRLAVFLSVDGQEWTEEYRHDGTKFFGDKNRKPLAVPLNGKVARFLRIELPGHEYLHLDEVEVYGPDGSDNLAVGRPANQSSVSSWSRNHLPQTEAAVQANILPQPSGVKYPLASVIDRGLKLTSDLTAQGVDLEREIQTLRRIEAELAGLPAEPMSVARRSLYLEARWAVRKIMLANPLLDFKDLLFVKRAPGSFTHMSDQYYGWWSRPGGGLYVLRDFKSDNARLECLTDSFEQGSFLRPDLTYDGTKVLFAFCRYYPGLREEPNKLDKNNVPEDAFYHLYEMDLATGRSRRLTRGKYDDFDGRYLADGRITFLSTRRGQQVQYERSDERACIDGTASDCYVRCGGGPERPVAVYTLHVMNDDGSGLAPISPFEMFEWTPSVDHDGRILYARWDYVDRHNMPYMSLWSTMPDGSGTQAVFGNYTRNPHCIFEPRPIPGSSKLVFTASGHHANTGGSLVMLDVHRGVDGEAPMTRLTPEVAFPETEGWPKSYFANPFPLSEQLFLVAWSDKEMTGWPGPAEPVNALGIYLFDTYGNLELISRDPLISSVTPLPMSSRRKPFQVASIAADALPDEAQMLLLDVYRGLETIPRGTIRNLRLVGVPAKTHPTMNQPVLGVTRDDPGKFVLGTVPVEEDGSALFRVPPGVTIFVQALDQDGMAVQTMRSAFYLQPGQTQTCVGCHEPRTTAPPIHRPMAVDREPSRITPGPDGSWPLDYLALVQPVLDRHCVSCHAADGEANAFILTADKSYESLVGFGKPSLAEHVLARYLEGQSQPGACTARVNSLWKLLDAGHYDVTMNESDRARVITWMDTYGQRTGSFDQEQQEQLRQLRRRMAKMLN